MSPASEDAGGDKAVQLFNQLSFERNESETKDEPVRLDRKETAASADAENARDRRKTVRMTKRSEASIASPPQEHDPVEDR